MRLIYKDIAKKLLTPDRVLKYENWVEEAETARKSGLLSKSKNQYDKAEELITFYTFAPLAHEKIPNQVKNKIIEKILSLAHMDENVREAKLHLEKDLPPPQSYLKWLSDKVRDHPIRYIRREAVTKRKLEGYTQVDAIIQTYTLLILIEVKFTSDISPQTKFCLIRNQIARLIDVGISEASARQKKLIVLLCTPSEPFQRRSRLYYYKIQEYSDTTDIQKDIPWRRIEEINETLKKATWISLEKILETVYQNTERYLDSKEFIEVKHFFKERKLWTSRAKL